MRLSLAGTAVLVALAGCGRGWVQFQERDDWRHQAEVDCLKTGAVKVGSSIVRMEPIAGPGMCGADFPLKVAALGDSPAIGFADELRPPGAIPNASPATMPQRWPIAEPRYSAPAEIYVPPPPAARYAPPSQPRAATPGAPISILPPGMSESIEDDIPDDAVLPPGRHAAPAYPQTRPAYRPPASYPQAAPEPRVAPSGPALGPSRGQVTGTLPPAAVTPTATLACPIVSALDSWVAAAVQPAALRWFRQPVVEIKQISAYSCRGMNGQSGARISEHAFGNALDIAAFVLADGRKITVKGGWQGSPEEQGFLHDVQGAACQQFSTVLAPGSNRFHYDHIHVDLMRRASGRRVCQPGAIDGEAVARAAERSRFARRGEPTTTGSIGQRNAVPGEDDEYADEDDAEEGITLSNRKAISAPPAAPFAPVRRTAPTTRVDIP